MGWLLTKLVGGISVPALLATDVFAKDRRLLPPVVLYWLRNVKDDANGDGYDE